MLLVIDMVIILFGVIQLKAMPTRQLINRKLVEDDSESTKICSINFQCEEKFEQLAAQRSVLLPRPICIDKVRIAPNFNTAVALKKRESY